MAATAACCISLVVLLSTMTSIINDRNCNITRAIVVFSDGVTCTVEAIVFVVVRFFVFPVECKVFENLRNITHLYRAIANLTVPGGQELHFPHFSSNLISFSCFSSSLTYFLPHFGSPGGRLAHLGRPWLRHCICKLSVECVLWFKATPFWKTFLKLKQLFNTKLLISRLQYFSVPKITVVRHV